MLIAGPNLTVDRTIRLDRFDAGHVHRARQVDARIGGGGANASRVAAQLNGSARLVSLIPEADVPSVRDALAGEGIELELVRCRGQLRVGTILQETAGRISLLNEPGPRVELAEWEEFCRLVDRSLRRGEVLLCTGSLPPGTPANGYARMAYRARHHGSRCVIDVAGEALAATLAEGEGVLVPNLAEAESMLDGPRAQVVAPGDDAPERAMAAADALLRSGATTVVVTAGRAGAAFAEQGPSGPSGWVPAPAVAACNPIGAGDAFAGGLALKLEAGAALGEAVEFAAKVAAAHVGAADGSLRDVMRAAG